MLCDSPAPATIIGDRTNHPRHGASSDLYVVHDGRRAGPFAYYADAYAYALDVVGGDPALVRRNGRRAPRP